jgi:hypothetical protein
MMRGCILGLEAVYYNERLYTIFGGCMLGLEAEY